MLFYILPVVFVGLSLIALIVVKVMEKKHPHSRLH